MAELAFTKLKKTINMIKVYHTKELWSGFEEIHPAPKFPDDYEYVASAESNDLDEVYEQTNNIGHPWNWNDGLTTTGEEQYRSTSVGDILEKEDGTLWRCELFGWKEIGKP